MPHLQIRVRRAHQLHSYVWQGHRIPPSVHAAPWRKTARFRSKVVLHQRASGQVRKPISYCPKADMSCDNSRVEGTGRSRSRTVVRRKAWLRVHSERAPNVNKLDSPICCRLGSGCSRARRRAIVPFWPGLRIRVPAVEIAVCGEGRGGFFIEARSRRHLGCGASLRGL